MQLTQLIRRVTQTWFVSSIALALFGCSTTVEQPVATGKIPEAVQTAPATKPKPTNRPIPALLIVGDSTVHNESPGLVGWGDVIGQHFDTNRIMIQNDARPGRSSRTFQTQGWWERTLATSRPGDFLLIQFGHNDSSAVNDTNRSRGTLPGFGNETTNFVNGLTHRRETVHTYGWYLRDYIATARKHGIIPIICTPVPRLPDPEKEMDVTRYISWAREVATAEKVGFIDLYGCVMDHYAGMSTEQIKTNFYAGKDTTHFNRTGAEQNAACVVSGVRALTNCPLKDFLLKEPRR